MAGAIATGARGNLASASVYHVTNLNDTGSGSLRDAVSQPNRFVVFDVGGIINLTPASAPIVVKNNVTIAGQTAPGGIVVYGQRLSYSGANNSITRFLGVHKGYAGTREDSVSLANGSNMMFDHMSVTWGVDETFSLNWDGKGNSIDNITIQNSIIAQGQDRLGHSAGGLMTLPEGGRFSILESIFADNVTRNPKIRGENEFINNVIYGWETAAYIMGDTTSMDSHANVIGNYFIEGPVDGGSPFTSGTANFHIYGRDNWVDTNRNGVLDGTAVTSYPGANVVSTPFAFPSTATMTAQQAVESVLENAGLSIVRDVVDARIIQEIRSYGTLGGVIQRETDLFPGYGTNPLYVSIRGRLVDTDNDGMADNWETAHGLNPADANGWRGLNAADYTRLEEYVNELGADGTMVGSLGGTWASPATWSGTVPTLADSGVVIGTVTVAANTHAFARRLNVDGSLGIYGGTIDVFDTATLDRGTLAVIGGTATFGQLLLGSPGQTATLSLSAGGRLESGPICSNGGSATFAWNGGVLRTLAASTIEVATTLGTGGGTLDDGGFNVVYSGRITGSGRLIKQGSGSVTLSGTNSYAGGTAVTGTLRLTNSNAAGTGPISIAAAGGMVSLANGVTLSNNMSTDYIYEVLDVPDANSTATYAGSLTRFGSRQIRLKTTGANATLNVTGSITAPSGFYLSQGNVVVAGNGSVTGGGGAAVGRGDSVSLTLRDSATFSVGGFSLGGAKAMPNGMITVRDNATLSTGTSTLDLLNTTSATAFSELNLDGGTTTVGGFLKTSTSVTQTSKLNFNGGTLRSGGSGGNANFLPALIGLTAVVQAGGARMDSNGQMITIAQPLIHDPALPTVDGGLTKLGAGILTLSGANTFNGGTSIEAGTLEIAHASAVARSVVTVAAGGMLRIANGTAMRAPAVILDGGTLTGSAVTVSPVNGITTLAINAGTIFGSPGLTLGTGGRMSLSRDRRVMVSVGDLTVDLSPSGGRLDLGAGQVSIAAGGTTPAELRAAILAGRNDGNWNGATGITSTAVTVAGVGQRTVGYVFNADGSSGVSFAAPGDTDLNGVVNVFDLITINSSGAYGTGAAADWSDGDVTYDGVTNVFDLVAINSAGIYGKGSYFPAAPSVSGGMAVVPEPASLGAWGLAAVVACGLARQRRRGV